MRIIYVPCQTNKFVSMMTRTTSTTATMTSTSNSNKGDSQISKTPFVRELAASDRKTRDKALDSLTRFLRARDDLDLLELLKIWKGLFFCFYHSDRPLTQQALARSLSYSLVPQLPRSRGFLLRFLRAFWITIGREFHALDRLRLDKYLFLIRCYVGVAFEVFVKEAIPISQSNQENRPAEQGAGADDNNSKKRKLAGDANNTSNHNNKKKKRSKRGGDALENDDDKEAGEDRGDEVVEEGDSSNASWTELESYISMLEEGPLCPLNFRPDSGRNATGNSKTKSRSKSKSQSQSTYIADNDTIPMPLGPDGLRYHIMDVWLDELAKVLELDSDESTEDADTTATPKPSNKNIPIDLLLRPFTKLRKEGLMKTVRQRAGDVIDDDRLVTWGFREPSKQDDTDESAEDDEEWGGFDD